MGLLDLAVPKFAFKMPWFMFDISNKQLITSPIIPSDIKDTKEIVLTEHPIPGLNYSPITPGGAGNRKIRFTLPLIKRNNTVGNVLMLKQFDMLRNNAVDITEIFTSSSQFESTPRVLYYWGTGSIPLVWWVKRCNATHKQHWVNELGFPQVSEIEFELWLDETHPLYLAEEVFRKAAALLGMVSGVVGLAGEYTPLETGRPY